VNRELQDKIIDMRTKLTLLLLLITIVGAYAQTEQRIAKTPRVNYDWRPGFVSTTELVGAFGLAEDTSPYAKYYYGISTIAGYQFTRNIKAGAGLGIHRHNDGTLFPFFVDARFSFNSQQIVPFLSASGGVALSINDISAQSRIFISPSAGVKWVAANRTGISASIGLMTMSGATYRSSFVNFKLGLELKGKN